MSQRAVRGFLASFLAWATVALIFAGIAHAQLSEVKVDKSAAAELYVKKRPPVPESPRLPKLLEKRLIKAEKNADKKRAEAIKLLELFLDTDPTGDGRAEGLFKLAELLWEDTRRNYIKDMDSFEREMEACRRRTKVCGKKPKEPQLDFTRPEKLYKTILTDHPNYRRTDLVLYLVGFAAREDGRVNESLNTFKQVIERFPESPLYGDSWMMIGENFFTNGKWEQARSAYKNILDRPESPSFDLALFKTAWCDWKLGDSDMAAKRFKQVLDLAAEAEKTGTQRERRRRAQLRDEALDYLVLVFTEDESIKAKDVYDFLASIGGEQYSEAVLVRLADLFFTQADYERSVEAYRFLINLRPASIDAAKYQRRVVDAYMEALEGDKTMAEIKVLVDNYGLKSDWAEANKDSPRSVKRVYKQTEALVRGIGKGFHAEAQAFEKQRRKPDIKLYTRAANTYEYYLSAYSKDKHATEARFLRAEIMFFKLGKAEEAGDEYLKVGKSAPVGKYHKDALLKAMAAFKKARPTNVDTTGRRELLPVDRKFAEATDMYATLFPADPEIVGVIYENGELFYKYGDYDEAIKRFGLIVTKYPDHQNAGAAGDRILEGLAKAEDYENIEEWARKLKSAKAFQSNAEQKRLDRIIVESIGKSGEKYSKAGRYERAAKFYLRVPKEFPNNSLAPKSYFNAAVMFEKAKKPEEAAATYIAMSDRYKKHELAQKAAFTAAQVYESVAYFERAAEAYEIVAKRYPRTERGADALFNAGVIRQALGQPRRAIKHYEAYAKRFRKKKDTEEVAFRVGVVYEQAGNDGRAERAFKSYMKKYRGGSHLVEAETRAGRSAYRLGQLRRSAGLFQNAQKRWKRSKGAAKKNGKKWAAEARYYEGELLFRKYDAIKLDVKPKSLDRTLNKKMKFLDQASTIYLDVLEFGDAQWGTAALYRIGSIMEEFAASLREAPPPPGLSKQEKEMYRDALDNKVIDIEEKAIELYTTGYEKALTLKVYNKFTKKLREALGRMAASRYPPVKEARDSQRLGNRTPSPGLVKEVIRDN